MSRRGFVRQRRPGAASLVIVLCLALLLLWTPLAAAADAAAVAHKEEAAAAVSLNDDDGAESPWHEATAPTRPRKPHTAKEEPKPPRALQQQQQQQTPPPTRAPTRPPTRTPTRAPTRLPTRAPTAPTKQPTRRPTLAPTRRPTPRPTARATQWPTAGPTRRAPPPSQVVLGGKSMDRVMAVVMGVLGAIALLSIVAAVAYWCCRRPAQACVASLCPRRGRNGGGGGGAAASSSTTTNGATGHLAVASLYYDAEEQAHPERYAAFRTPPRRSGTLVGRPLDPLAIPPPPVSSSHAAPAVVVGPLSPPVSPYFDPFGRAAIEYMAPAGVWPPTPQAVRRAAAAAIVVGQEEEEEDDYGELVRLLTAEEEGASPQPSPSLALHPGDLRMEPLPFATTSSSRSACAAKYRGRLGCTLPPPLPVVAVASPVPVMGAPLPATDSTRDLGTVVRAPGGDEEEEEAVGEGDPGVPVVVTVLFAPVAPGAAPAARDALARLRAVTAAYPELFAPVLGMCCRGDRRRVALVEGAWPGARALGEALPPLLSLPPSDQGAGGGAAARQRIAAFLRVGLQLAEALTHLHAAGLSHGDLRPANVLLDRRTLRAKLTGARVAALDSAQRGQHQGAAEEAGEGDDDDPDLYLAPECWAAPSTSSSSATAASADVYALAVLLWGVWARQRPYAGLRLSRPELREAVCARGLRPTSSAASVAWAEHGAGGAAGASAPPPELPSAFEALLSEMWAPEAGARPGAALVAARLRALQAAME